MAVSITNANGEFVSLVGAGNTAYAGGTPTNPGSFSSGQSFGQSGAGNGSGSFGAPAAISNFGSPTRPGASRNSPSEITATRAGSTSDLGYTDPAAASRGTRSGGGGGGGAGSGGASSPQLTARLPIGIAAAKPKQPEMSDKKVAISSKTGKPGIFKRNQSPGDDTGSLDDQGSGPQNPAAPGGNAIFGGLSRPTVPGGTATGQDGGPPISDTLGGGFGAEAADAADLGMFA
jgi:hypothetical protein